MKLRTMALAGSAAVAIGAAAGFAFPAHSAVLHHHRHSAQSTENSQEQQTTKQLNEQQLQSPGTQASIGAQASADTQTNAQTNDMAQSDRGNQIAETSTAAGATPDKDTSAAPSTAGVATARVGSEIDKAVGPDRPVTKAELRQAVSLSHVANPTATLATAEIKNRKGEALGAVKAVDVTSNGAVRDVKADVGGFLGVGEREVSLDAHNLVYLKDRNLLVTDMTKPQIENLPPVGKSY